MNQISCKTKNCVLEEIPPSVLQSITDYCSKYELGDLLSRVDFACLTEWVQQDKSFWKQIFRKHKKTKFFYSLLTPGFLIAATLSGPSQADIKIYLLEKIEIKNQLSDDKVINRLEIIGISLGATQIQSLLLNMENNETTQGFIKCLNERGISSV